MQSRQTGRNASCNHRCPCPSSTSAPHDSSNHAMHHTNAPSCAHCCEKRDGLLSLQLDRRRDKLPDRLVCSRCIPPRSWGACAAELHPFEHLHLQQLLSHSHRWLPFVAWLT